MSNFDSGAKTHYTSDPTARPLTQPAGLSAIVTLSSTSAAPCLVNIFIEAA